MDVNKAREASKYIKNMDCLNEKINFVSNVSYEDEFDLLYSNGKKISLSVNDLRMLVQFWEDCYEDFAKLLRKI